MKQQQNPMSRQGEIGKNGNFWVKNGHLFGKNGSKNDYKLFFAKLLLTNYSKIPQLQFKNDKLAKSYELSGRNG